MPWSERNDTITSIQGIKRLLRQDDIVTGVEEDGEPIRKVS